MRFILIQRAFPKTKVVKSLNAVLDKAVLETVKKYEYKPGTINGQEVKFQAMEVFNFENR